MRNQLSKLGICINDIRRAVWFQLATEVPASGLARTLGMDIMGAASWQRASAGDWTGDAAEVGCRCQVRRCCGDSRRATQLRRSTTTAW